MRHEDREFRGETIQLNGNGFVKCRFMKCTLIYTGVGAVELTGCSFGGCEFRLEGPAADTAAFMKALYRIPGGGRELVLSVFKDVAPDINLN
jgi:hypothetical protein